MICQAPGVLRGEWFGWDSMKRARSERDDAMEGDRKLLNARAPDGHESGYTLVELLCAIAIMGIVIAPIMNSVIASIGASSTARNLAQVQTVLQNAADRVNRSPKSCDYLIFAQAAVLAEGWSADRATVEQLHYAPAARTLDAGTWQSNACEGTVPSELLVQLVRITVTSPNGQVRKTIEVVKSDI